MEMKTKVFKILATVSLSILMIMGTYVKCEECEHYHLNGVCINEKCDCTFYEISPLGIEQWPRP